VTTFDGPVQLIFVMNSSFAVSGAAHATLTRDDTGWAGTVTPATEDDAWALESFGPFLVELDGTDVHFDVAGPDENGMFQVRQQQSGPA
jgi:hypothetical protein